MLMILMYIANILIILAFLWYLLLVFTNNSKFTESDGFNVTKDILSEYDSINIIENKSIFTVYNLKRKVIKIASKRYYGNTLSDISLPLLEAGISATNNKYLGILSKILSNLKKLYVLPIIMVIVGSGTYNLGDARIAMPLVIICALASYIMIDIKNEAYLWLDKHINKKLKIDKVSVLKYINKIIMIDKLIFFGELIMIIRFVAIILGINWGGLWILIWLR